jgi:hypothetical protein
MIIKEYYEQFYTNKLDNLDEMDKLPETQDEKPGIVVQTCNPSTWKSEAGRS